jgi:thioesterase domain-containing protein
MTDVAAFPRLIPVVSGKDRPRCLILPGAGAGFVPYARLAAGLGDALDLGVDFVRALGLLPEESPEHSIAQMAGSVLDLLATTSTVPQSVFGWSLGGLVGWEVCVALAARGNLPDLVIVDSSPQPEKSEPAEQERVRNRIVDELGRNADQQTIDRVVRTLAAQSAAFADYRARQRYPGRVLLLTCAPQHALERVAAVRLWRELAPRLTVGQLDAGHHEIFEPAHLPQLIAAVGDFLRPASLPTAPPSQTE